MRLFPTNILALPMFLLFLLQPTVANPAPETLRVYSVEAGRYVVVDRVVKSAAEWSRILPADVFHITRQEGTESAYSGKYWDHHAHGVYRCAACGQDLFLSDTKYDSGTGWPSFYQPVAPENIGTSTDTSFFMVRTEVHCSRCGSHLGHVFGDGPEPTGKRYCINSAALTFAPLKQEG